MEEPSYALGIMPSELPGSSSRALAVPRTASREAFAAERMTRRRSLLTLGAAFVGATGLVLWRDLPTALLFLACAGVTRLFVPAVGRFARRAGAVALPGGRGIHEVPTPLIGGAALFVPVAATLLVLGCMGDTKAWGLLGGGTIIFLSGLLDDIKGTRARHKIFAQLLAGGVLLATGFRLPAFGIPEVGVFELAPSFVGSAALLFWIVLATNALNLSDGLDGLATSLAILGMGVLAAAGAVGLLPVALAGACLGFLYFNLPKARIFLGDAGSLLLGFLLAALVLRLPVNANVPLALAVFAYPLGDVSLTVLRRIVRGKPLFAPDRSHIHHKALQYLGSPTRALLALLFFSAVQGAALVTWPGVPALLFCAALWIALGAVLAFAGGYQPAQLMLARRGMRRLHSVQGYVGAALQTARVRTDVVQALRYLAEALAIEKISVGGLQVTSGEMTPSHIQAQDVSVGLPAGDSLQTARFCTWSAAPTMQGAAVDQERETIMAGLLRLAADRLQRFSSVSNRAARPTRSPRSSVSPRASRSEDPACNPTLTHNRPSPGRAHA